MNIRNRINNEYVGARDYIRHDGLDRLNAVDDNIQSGLRSRLYGQQPDGSYDNDGIRKMIGELIHIPRDAYGPDQQWQLAANRSVQYGAMGGGVTAAGAGLIELTQRMAETFGGSGDISGSDTLYM